MHMRVETEGQVNTLMLMLPPKRQHKCNPTKSRLHLKNVISMKAINWWKYYCDNSMCAGGTWDARKNF